MLPGVIGPEAPEMPLEVAHGVLARSVRRVGELAYDVGARRLRAGVVRVDVGDADVDPLRRRRPGIRAGAVGARSEDDHAGPEPELGVRHGATRAGDDDVLLEAEGLREPFDGGGSV